MKTKLLSTSLFVVVVGSPCFLTSTVPVDAFSLDGASLPSVTMWESRSHRRIPSQQRRMATLESKTKMFVKDPSNQEGKSSVEEGESQTLTKKEDERTDMKETVRKVGKKVGISAVYGFSFFMNIVGLYFTAGLVLNIFGYAYEFSFEEGYKIDTIQNKRIERQFEQESRRYERERDERVMMGAANSFSSETVAELAGSTK
eukprot:CAMPEP_0197273554 /NCGR_PEP_ID=MMETSP1432-20130617/11424_1 /TAXON_ID=44447 /ORGANISM="Pseudo-nitzschia delicatissima, Strain UNC1205" /LENGTH=200 /DNA_ID=CAMNT_0042739227 /DNA_START=39 /DNA_END=641 /DNA_ORIENTATION=-